MTDHGLTPEEHEKFMRRAIELGAKGGLEERVGGKSRINYLSEILENFTPAFSIDHGSPNNKFSLQVALVL